jgi:hypothetical protein
MITQSAEVIMDISGIVLLAALTLAAVVMALVVVLLERQHDRTAVVQFQRYAAYRALLRGHGRWQGHGGTIAFDRGPDLQYDASAVSQSGV